MVLILCSLFFLILCTLTFLPFFRLFYVRNPALVGMLFTLPTCFLGVYLAIELSQSRERQDRMARAAVLMEIAKENLSVSQMDAKLNNPLKPVALQTKELTGLLNNGAVLEQISPLSLNALLASQGNMEKELSFLATATGRNRRHHLNVFIRELTFAQGVLAAEAEFQRGHIGRKDLSEMLNSWIAKKDSPSI